MTTADAAQLPHRIPNTEYHSKCDACQRGFHDQCEPWMAIKDSVLYGCLCELRNHKSSAIVGTSPAEAPEPERYDVLQLTGSKPADLGAQVEGDFRLRSIVGAAVFIGHTHSRPHDPILIPLSAVARAWVAK